MAKSRIMEINNTGMTSDERELWKNTAKKDIPGQIASSLFLIIFISLVLTGTLDFSKVNKTTTEELSDLQSRIGYVYKYSAPGALWVLGCVFAVTAIRTLTPAMDPTSGHEHRVQNTKNILNNSFEQFVLSLVSQLILVQYLDAEHTLKYIPALALLFILGRITFTLGYPNYRGFGFNLNIIPLTLTMVYDFYKTFGLFF